MKGCTRLSAACVMLLTGVQALFASSVFELTELSALRDTLDLRESDQLQTLSIAFESQERKCSGISIDYINERDSSGLGFYQQISERYSYSGNVSRLIVRGTAPGLYQVETLRLYYRDSQGYTDTDIFNPELLDSLGFDPGFFVISDEDTSGPELLSLELKSDTLFSAGDSAFQVIYLECGDSEAGLGSLQLEVRGPGEGEPQYLYRFYNEKDPIYRSSDTLLLKIDPWSAEGEWTIEKVYLSDRLGNYRSMDSTDLQARGFNPSFYLQSVHDSEGPVLKEFRIRKEFREWQGEEISDSLIFDISAEDDLSGICCMRVQIQGPLRNEAVYFRPEKNVYINVSEPGSMTVELLNAGHEIYGLRPGLWKARVFLEDMAGNLRQYETEDLRVLGFSTSITTGHGGPVFHVRPDGDSELGCGTFEKPFASIQEALHSMWSGDTLLLHDGVYSGEGNRDIFLHDPYWKSLVLRSLSGPENCIIDCEGLGRGFLMENHYSMADSLPGALVIEGITVRNGSARLGGGMLIRNIRHFPLLKRMIFENCSADDFGGGLNMAGSQHLLSRRFSPIAADIVFRDCSAGQGGGGLFIGPGILGSDPAALISGCSFIGNSAPKGGGLYLYQRPGIVMNSLFSGNSSEEGSAIFATSTSYINVPRYCDLTLLNSTVSENPSSLEGALHSKYAELTVRNSIVWPDRVTGDGIDLQYSLLPQGHEGVQLIHEDPGFNDAAAGDFRLSSGSPGIDAGDPDRFYRDADGSRNDLGFQGGGRLLPSEHALNFQDIGSEPRGKTEDRKTVYLSNGSQDTLSILSMELHSPAFRVSAPEGPLRILPFSTDSLTVLFSGEGAGVYSDSLQLSFGDGRSAGLALAGVQRLGSILNGRVKGVFSREQSPLTVTGDVRVAAGDSLLLLPGVEVLFEGRHHFDIEGAFRAEGAPGDSVIFRNRADSTAQPRYGIRLINTDSPAQMSHCRIEGGSALMSGYGRLSDFHGGGILLYGSDAEIRNSLITGNSGGKNGGLSIFNAGGKRVLIEDCEIRDNIGGGLSIWSSSPVIRNSLIRRNSQSGLKIENVSVGPRIIDTQILNNTGTAVYAEDASAEFVRCRISGNSSGALSVTNYDEERKRMLFRGCTIVQNSRIFPPALLYATGDLLDILFISSTLADNYSSHREDESQVELIFEAQAVFVNSILDHPVNGVLELHEQYPGSVYAEHSLIRGGAAAVKGDMGQVDWGPGILSSAAEFLDRSAGEYALGAASVCIDAGTDHFNWRGDEILIPDSLDFLYGAPDLGSSETVYIHPGDTDNDGRVGPLDILPIAWYYTEHCGESEGKAEQKTPQWLRVSGLHSGDLALKFADCDGSGTIEAADMMPLLQQWGLEHGHSGPEYTISADLFHSDPDRFRPVFSEILANVDREHAGRQEIETLILSLVDSVSMPWRFELADPYPNPFNGGLYLPFTLEEPGRPEIRIIDIRGAVVQVLGRGILSAGEHRLFWDGRNRQGRETASGIYFAVLSSGDRRLVRKIMRLR